MKFNVLIVNFWRLIHAKILRTCCVRLVFRKPEILGTVPLFQISLKNYFLIKLYFTDARWYGIDENHQNYLIKICDFYDMKLHITDPLIRTQILILRSMVLVSSLNSNGSICKFVYQGFHTHF